MFHPLIFVVNSTINLINKPYYECERRETIFDVLRKYLRITYCLPVKFNVKEAIDMDNQKDKEKKRKLYYLCDPTCV